MEHQEKNHRILIVDDEPSICQMLAHCLVAAGYDVATASSLGSAREALDLGYFPVVITDLSLSGRGPMEGLEVLHHARKCSPKTSVIVMSADVSDELREKVRLLGARHCYAKPFETDEMLGSVREIIGEAVIRKTPEFLPLINLD